MPVLTATNLRHAYGDDIVLDGLSFTVEAGEKVAIVGRNGAGKSTLIKALGGLLAFDSGTVSVQKGCKASYLGQEPDLDLDETLRTSAEAGLGELHDLHAQLDSVFEQMAEAEGEALEKLLKKQAALEERVERAGGYAVGHRVDAVLHGLGFVDTQFGIKVGSLSGGQRARLGLARLLLEQPDVLLLDEPTNHLDLDGRIWLETFLRDEFKGAVVLISHDRYLLDAVVDRIVEVEHARLIEYPGEDGGSYAKFRELRAERREVQMRMYEKQQERFKREEAYIRKYKAGQRSKQAKGRESLLDREKTGAYERPMEVGEMRLNLPKAERTGEVVVATRGLSKTYTNETGERTLFKDLSVSVRRGERWGVIGPNGAGKTTLVRAMLGEIETDAGSVKIGTNVKIGYFRQDRTELDHDLPTYRAIAKAATKHNPELRLSEQESRNLAGAFLFTGEEQDKPVHVLSGGEKSRVALAALLASAKNVLVLDEPTNHLDIPSAERLEETLSADGGFDGTLILISHDRALLDACCDHILALDGEGNAQEVTGNYTDWAAKREHRGSFAAPSVDAPARQRSAPAPSKPEPSKQPKPAHKSRFSWMQTDKIEERMHELESDVAALDEKLGLPETWADPAESSRLNEERSKLTAELEELEEEWLHRAE